LHQTIDKENNNLIEDQGQNSWKAVLESIANDISFLSKQNFPFAKRILQTL